MPIAREQFSFNNQQGTRLAARLEEPTVAAHAYALFAHCFTCSKDIAAASRISRALVQRGFGVLRFDFTGIGNSEGDFSNTNFSSNVEDLIAAADHLRELGKAPALLIGHSFGGAAVLAAAGQIPEAKAVVTIAAPADPLHLKQVLPDAMTQVEQTGKAAVQLGGRQFTIKKQFLDDIASQSLAPRIAALGRALLILHAPADEIVDIEQARQIFEQARHPKSFISLDTADHLLSHRADSVYVADIIAIWASRYMPQQDNSATPLERGM